MELITSTALNELISFVEMAGIVPEKAVYIAFSGTDKDTIHRRLKKLKSNHYLSSTLLAGESALTAIGADTISPPERQRAYAWLVARACKEGFPVQNGKLELPKSTLRLYISPEVPTGYPALIVVPYGYSDPEKLPGTYICREEDLYANDLSAAIRRHTREV